MSTKKIGGLGVICIANQNSTLLSKFLTKIHSDPNVPWVSWFRRFYGWLTRRVLGDAYHLDTLIWKNIASHLPAFRLHSLVTVGNGHTTSFWMDTWLGTTPLGDCFTTLFSHSTRQNTSIFLDLDSPITTSLVPRLSYVASSELATLQSALANIQLEPDK